MSSYTKGIIIEGSVIGLSVVFLGTLISFIISMLQDQNFSYLKNPEMYLALFLTGFLLHVGLDVIGFNKWYCKNCVGCK
jgi:uncharacterized membrane protein|tara:strand:+ start:4623 stop:4859 length:237 start_codon:yes stop_codon:yes gene_type:complete